MFHDRVYVHIQSADIDLFTKIVEACGHIGVVSTLDSVAGLVMVRVTPDTLKTVLDIVAHLPFPAEAVTGQFPQHL